MQTPTRSHCECEKLKAIEANCTNKSTRSVYANLPLILPLTAFCSLLSHPSTVLLFASSFSLLSSNFFPTLIFLYSFITAFHPSFSSFFSHSSPTVSFTVSSLLTLLLSFLHFFKLSFKKLVIINSFLKLINKSYLTRSSRPADGGSVTAHWKCKSLKQRIAAERFTE